MLEVEVKYRAVDHAALEYQLLRWSAHLVDNVEESDAYFNAPHRDFAKTDEAFRVRRIGPTNFVTYKGPKTDAQTKTRREIEVRLGDGTEAANQFEELLIALGFRLTAVVRKRRKTYHLHRDDFTLHICLDDVENVGKYAEVEIVAPESDLDRAKTAVLKVAAELGLTEMERRSYLELLLKFQSDKPGIVTR
jgi:adenylate cyclase class 2